MVQTVRIEAVAGARMVVAAMTSGTHDDQLAEKIRLLDASPVDDELAALKQKMSLLGAGSTPAPRAPDDVS